MIRISKGGCRAIEGRLIKVPFWRSDLPDELREIAPVFIVTRPAALGGKIVLIPPLELGIWRQRYPASLLVPDQIAAHGNHCITALRPERRYDVGRPRPPIKPRNRGFPVIEPIHTPDHTHPHTPILVATTRLAS